MQKRKNEFGEINYTELFRAVILQSIIDFFYFEDHYGDKKLIKTSASYDAKNNEIEAKKFFKSKFFDIICDFASLNKNFVLKNMKEIYERSKNKKIK